MPELPKILTRRTVSSSRLFKVEGVALEFSNGERREYEYLLAGESAAVIVVAMISERECLLIQEYGVGLNAYEWGLPKGKVDTGETILDAANRELKEEAGYGAEELIPLKCISQSPNYMEHKTHVVLARRLYPEKREGDEPEPLAVKRCSMDNLGAELAQTDLSEARSIAAIYLAKTWLDESVHV